MNVDAPETDPVPEPTDETAMRRQQAVRRRRARGGRAVTVNPTRPSQPGGPQPVSRGSTTRLGFSFGSGGFFR